MTTSRHQRGFAAVSAIFLVVILAALGAFMVTFSNTQHLTSAQDLQGTRAYWAARAGLEWGIGRVSAAATASDVCNTPANTPMSIDGFSVTVTCTGFGASAAYTEADHSVYIFQFTSTAATGTVGTVGRIERSISASMECVKNDTVSPPTYSCG